MNAARAASIIAIGLVSLSLVWYGYAGLNIVRVAHCSAGDVQVASMGYVHNGETVVAPLEAGTPNADGVTPCVLSGAPGLPVGITEWRAADATAAFSIAAADVGTGGTLPDEFTWVEPYAIIQNAVGGLIKPIVGITGLLVIATFGALAYAQWDRVDELSIIGRGG